MVLTQRPIKDDRRPRHKSLQLQPPEIWNLGKNDNDDE
jgi:hypothetical protein